MKRVGFLLKVKQDLIEEYKIHHQNVWPEMKSALNRHGWKNYSLFMTPDGLLFGYCEPEISFEDSLDGKPLKLYSKKFLSSFNLFIGFAKSNASKAIFTPLLKSFSIPEAQKTKAEFNATTSR